jgi:hypothetical protein
VKREAVIGKPFERKQTMKTLATSYYFLDFVMQNVFGRAILVSPCGGVP